jgi:hypothetical protein
MARSHTPKEEDWPKILVLIELAKLITWIVSTAWGVPGAP